MNDGTALTEPTSGGSNPCIRPFLLSELQVGKKDKLGHTVAEILWIGRDYEIYLSEKGVYVQFSDCWKVEEVQRNRFTEICPELCELRYLTYQMGSGFKYRTGRHTSSLYDHNIAQAVMLVMEEKVEEGRLLAQQTLKMAIQRVTNDNTIRYVRSCLICWVAWIVAGGVLYCRFSHGELSPYIVAGIFGATGAVLSVATRLQTFELKPCNQSNMNYWMSGIRVGIGVIAGIVLVLLAPSILSGAMARLTPLTGATEIPWQTAATLGLIGGFAERLIPILLRRAIDKTEPSDGTPVQAIRSEEMRQGSHIRFAAERPETAERQAPPRVR